MLAVKGYRFSMKHGVVTVCVMFTVLGSVRCTDLEKTLSL